MGKSRARGKGREWFEIDILEISATSTPTNPATRALSWKSTTDPRLEAEARDLMEIFERNAREHERERTKSAPEVATKSTAPIRVARFDV